MIDILTTKCWRRKFYLPIFCTNKCLFTFRMHENDDSFLFLLKRHTPEKKDKEVFTDGKNDFSAEKAPAREGSRFSCENELGRREKGSRSKKS